MFFVHFPHGSLMSQVIDLALGPIAPRHGVVTPRTQPSAPSRTPPAPQKDLRTELPDSATCWQPQGPCLEAALPESPHADLMSTRSIPSFISHFMPSFLSPFLLLCLFFNVYLEPGSLALEGRFLVKYLSLILFWIYPWNRRFHMEESKF